MIGHLRLIIHLLTPLALGLLAGLACTSLPWEKTEIPPTAEDMNDGIRIFSLSSPAFGNGENIPDRFTCEADNLSPALEWKYTPWDTRSLALFVVDPDAPSGAFMHWVLYNIPTSLTALPEGVPKDEQVAGIGTQGLNDFQNIGYDGPCPPPAKAHRYYFKLYALDLAPDLPAGLTAGQLTQEMEKGAIVGQVEWMGIYQR